jgi:antitoxin ParD1/3/4
MGKKNTSITLGDHFDSFISDQLESGRYASTSEVIRAGLRLLEEEEAKLVNLRHLLEEGEKSESVPYSLDALIAELDSESP